MSDRMYLGTLLGDDNRYYRPVLDTRIVRVFTSRKMSNGIRLMVVDENYIYATIGTTSGNSRMVKISKASYSEVATSGVLGTIHDMVSIGDYLYVARHTSSTDLSIYKLSKTTLTVVAVGELDTSSSVKLWVSDGFLYVTTAYSTRKLDPQNLSSVAESNYSSAHTVGFDDMYMYLWRSGNFYKLNKNSLSHVKNVSTIGNAQALFIGEEYFYFLIRSSNSSYTVLVIDKNTMLEVDSIPLANFGYSTLPSEKGFYFVASDGIYEVDILTMTTRMKQQATNTPISGIVRDGDSLFTASTSFIHKSRELKTIVGYEEVK